MEFIVLEHDFVVCSLDSLNEISIHDEYCFISKTDYDFSFICTSRYTPNKYIEIQKNYKAIRFVNVDINSTGFIAKVAALLSLNDISILSISTFDSEFFFVKNNKLNKVIDILVANNFIDITEM